jgi:hypothetical protein
VSFFKKYITNLISYLYDPSGIYHYRILQEFIENKNRIFMFFKNYTIYFNNKINYVINPPWINLFEFLLNSHRTMLSFLGTTILNSSGILKEYEFFKNYYMEDMHIFLWNKFIDFDFIYNIDFEDVKLKKYFLLNICVIWLLT